MDIILAIVVGVALGALVGFAVAQGRSKGMQGVIDGLRMQLDKEKAQAEFVSASLEKQMSGIRTDAKEQVETVKADCEKRIAEVRADCEKQMSFALESQEKRHAEALKAQQSLFDETMAKVASQVQTATDEMLKQRQKEFAESSNTNLGQIVSPLRDTIERMKQAMSESTLKHTELSAEMKANLENMIRHSEAAKQSTDELARVFKHKSKVQGNWGERVLDELLESQGLTQGVHYETQATIRDGAGNVVKTDTGAAMRPDVIMHLDSCREIVIDSKVSLTAFWDYVNAESDDDRLQYLKAHVDSVQKHVKELSKKDYSSYIKAPKVKMDYVIMFVPHTGALWAALNAQPDLWRKAMEMNVFIADEQTLFAALKMISLTWANIAQAENHEKVYALADELLDRVGKFMDSYESIGKALKSAQGAYEEGGKKLAPSGQSILQTCAKLERLGVKQSKKYPLPQIKAADGE
jgi:DNA recombination protein RmuC